MKLELGGLETIDNPGEEDIRHFLKFMPVECQFVILSDDSTFIQSTYNGVDYRVEYSIDHGHTNYFCLVDYASACDLFLFFLIGDERYQSSADWTRFKPQTTSNISAHPLVLSIACVIALIAIAVMIWQALK